MAANQFLVGVHQNKIAIQGLALLPPPVRLEKEQALNLAAWLVAVACCCTDDADFKEGKARFDQLLMEAINS